jgi:hypothetical protein
MVAPGDRMIDAIEGAEVTIVVGGGVSALHGTVEHVGDDYLVLSKEGGVAHYVPMSAIKYVRMD